MRRQANIEKQVSYKFKLISFNEQRNASTMMPYTLKKAKMTNAALKAAEQVQIRAAIERQKEE